MMRTLPNLRHIRAVGAVCRTLSVSAAADEMNITQPAATHAILSLERYFEATLFLRRPNGTYPTEAGKVAARRIERFMEQLVAAAIHALGSTSRSERTIQSFLNRLTASQIRVLVAIAHSGSFVGAARSIGLSEPALHRLARTLERSIGRPIYFRSPSGITVNRLGADLARRLALARLEIDQAFDEVRSLEGRVAGHIKIGSLPRLQAQVLPRAIGKAARLLPEATFEVIDGPYEGLMRNLRDGRIDFLIGALRRPPPFDDVSSEELFKESYSVVARCDHPLTRRPAVDLHDLGGFEWVIPKAGTPVRAAFHDLFSPGNHPRVNIETGSFVATRGLLLESDRLTLLSRRQIAIEMNAGLLTIVPFSLPPEARSIGLTTRNGWLPSAVQSRFVDCLRESAAEE